mmetsp:Transcript_38754/g.69859  ORF Transcript_38754/g.69859 Transcript_38754/m.69859 type:complete len:261 (+) Transcript_38754:1251-2033(+)
MVLHLSRLRRHLFRPTLEPQIHPLLFIRSIGIIHSQPCIGSNNCQLLQILDDSRFVGGPVSGNEHLHFGSDPFFSVCLLFVLDHTWAVFVNVNIQYTSGNFGSNFPLPLLTNQVTTPSSTHSLHMTTFDLNRYPRAFLRPNQCHLGPQTKFATCLTNSIFGSRKYSSQQFWNGFMCHATAIVANSYQEVRFASSTSFLYFFSFLVLGALVVPWQLLYSSIGSFFCLVFRRTRAGGHTPHFIKLRLCHLLNRHHYIRQDVY